MTRLIVKNLPDSANREKLLQTFSQKGLVTDLQLKYTKDGKFRHFAFLGYKTEEEAEAALKYFHNTYVGSCKISVEKCVRLGESVSVKDKKKGIAPAAVAKPEKPEAKETEDTKLAEFLEVHGQKKGGPALWGNDTASAHQTHGKSMEKSQDAAANSSKENEEDDEEDDEEVPVDPNAPANAPISDMEYLKQKVVKTETKPKVEKPPKPKKEFHTVKISGLTAKARKKEIKQLLAPLKPKSIRIAMRVLGVAYVGFATLKERNIALNKDRTFFEGKRISVRLYEKKVKETTNEDTLPPTWRQQAEISKNVDAIPETGRVFVRNLPYDVTEEELQKTFEQYGPVTEVIVPVDKFTRKGKGFALVTFMLPEHAAAAYSALDGSVFQGRMLHLLPAKEKPEPVADTEEEGSSYKKKKAQEQKAAAGVALSWNTLFLGANAVADVVAQTYGTTKADVLTEGQGQTSLAVRMALGETQVVAQTRSFLEENGVDLKAFTNQHSGKIDRSKTVLLVKNLPAGTDPNELRQLFEKHGVLGRVLLPPSGITAIIEFLEPAEARMAFRSLAYTKFHHVPLYLEWAPVNALIGPAKPSAPGGANGKAKAEPEEEVNPEDLLSEENATLFVKNLNWTTTDEDLRKLFEKCGPLVSATISRKLKDKELVSLGYGFVQYQRKKDALEALKTLQFTELNDHKLELKASNRQKKETEGVRKKPANAPISSKLCVRNVPFQASQKEVQDLFKTFGELKSVRLPKKVGGTGTHRGFAFVEFVTKEDAKRAFDALSASTHLYGRRLVLEWAAAEESVEDIRKRTAMNFFEGPSANKKKKTDMFDDVNEEEA